MPVLILGPLCTIESNVGCTVFEPAGDVERVCVTELWIQSHSIGVKGVDTHFIPCLYTAGEQFIFLKNTRLK